MYTKLSNLFSNEDKKPERPRIRSSSISILTNKIEDTLVIFQLYIFVETLIFVQHNLDFKSIYHIIFAESKLNNLEIGSETEN